MDFSILFFTSGERGQDPYRLVIDASRLADSHDFHAIWVPERHFSALGCIFPNAALMLTAIARETRRINLRAGSVAVPLHHPVRIAEEWAMLDNLSGGRAGFACATGWHPNDFVLNPANYDNRFDVTQSAIDTLRRLWRGEEVSFPGGGGEPVGVRTYPTPVQAEIPLWYAASSRPESFALAGEKGLNVITHLLLHDIVALREKVEIYRESRRKAGLDPRTGRVTVWVYAHLGEDHLATRRRASAVLKDYFKSDARQIFSGLFFHHKSGRSDIGQLSASDLDDYIGYVVSRLCDSGLTLFGAPGECVDVVARLKAAGVDEIACQPDLGFDDGEVLASLGHLADLKRLCAEPAFAQRLAELGAATPSGARPGAPPAREREPEAAPADSEDIETIKARLEATYTEADFYARFALAGMSYQEAFRTIRHVWGGRREALAEIHLAATDPQARMTGAIDGCVQAVAGALPDTHAQAVGVFGGVGAVTLSATVPDVIFSHARFVAAEGRDLIYDVRVYNAASDLIMTLQRVRVVASQVKPVEAARDQLHHLTWEEQALDARETPSARRVVIVADADADPRTRSLAEALSPHALLGERIAEQGVSDVVFVCRSAPELARMDADELGGLVESELVRCLDVVRELSASAAGGSTIRLWVVVPAKVGGEASARVEPALIGGPMAGFARTVAIEAEHIDCRLVFTDWSDPRALADEIAHAVEPDEVALSAGTRLVARLRELEPSPDEAWLADWEPAAWAVISGGTGAVGLAIAGALAERGVKKVLLLGRSQAGPAAVAVIDRLRSSGVEACSAQVDVTDEQALRAVLATLDGPIHAVVHAAGVLADALLAQQSEALLRKVAAPKVRGGWALHRATMDHDLKAFVCISSAASLIGSPGQANYAAANGFLDALAPHRRALGLPATTVQFGPWADAGMAGESQVMAARFKAQGVTPLEPVRALRGLAGVMMGEAAVGAVLNVSWGAFARRLGARLPRSLLALASDAGEAGSGPALALELAKLNPGERVRRLAELMQGAIARVLGLDASPDVTTPIIDFGLDSLMAVELKNIFRAEYGIDLPVVLLLEGPSIESLAARLTDGDIVDVVDGKAKHESRIVELTL